MCRQTSTHPHCLVVSTTRYLTNQDPLVPDPRACAFYSFCKLRSEHDCKPVLRAVYIALKLKEKILSLLLPRTSVVVSSFSHLQPGMDMAAAGSYTLHVVHLGPVLLTSHLSPKRSQAPLYSQTSHFNRMTRITKNFCRQNHASGRTSRNVRNHSPKLSHTHHRQHI